MIPQLGTAFFCLEAVGVIAFALMSLRAYSDKGFAYPADEAFASLLIGIATMILCILIYNAGILALGGSTNKLKSTGYIITCGYFIGSAIITHSTSFSNMFKRRFVAIVSCIMVALCIVDNVFLVVNWVNNAATASTWVSVFGLLTSLCSLAMFALLPFAAIYNFPGNEKAIDKRDA